MTIRVEKTKKNILYSYASNTALAILNLLSRAIFIKVLAIEYLGVNGLFADVLGILSFAELGLGNAMNFALYKPVALNDEKKICGLLNFYRKAYYLIGTFIALAGIFIIPFFYLIIKDPGNLGNLKLYFIIYVFNTSITYFVSYKYSYVYAKQENYVITKIDFIFSFITTSFQIITLLIFKNFLIYLLTTSITLILKMLFINRILSKKYPILSTKTQEKINEEELSGIKKNVFALVFHKIGDICVNQTDSIITSAVVSLTSVGLMSNYKMIIGTINIYISTIFSSALPSLGNVVAVENKKTQIDVFNAYTFTSFWVYGFSMLAFCFLLTPTVTLIFGDNMAIDNITVLLVCLNIYLSGQNQAYCHFKAANGSFSDDKFVVLISAGINLIVSIPCAMRLGLPGVYIGTVITSLFQNVARPIISYKKLTNESVRRYFLANLKYLLSVAITGVITYLILVFISYQNNVLVYVVRVLLVVIIPNIVLIIIYRNNIYFKYLVNLLKGQFLKKKHE